MNAPVEIGGEGGRDAAVAAKAGIVGFVSADERLVLLHSKLKRIAKARAHLDAQEAEALREAQKLQLWKQFGHTSLVDYMVQELGYASHRVAEDRLRLANALPELPKLTEALQSGNLNISQVREIARVATPETEEKWIARALDLNVREVEQAVAGHHKGDLPEDPIDPKIIRKTLWLSLRPETDVLFREVRKQLDKERGEKLDDDAVLDALCRTFLNGTSRRSGGRALGVNVDQNTDEDHDHAQVRASSHVGVNVDQNTDEDHDHVGVNVDQNTDEHHDQVVQASSSTHVAVNVDQNADEHHDQASSSTHVGANAAQGAARDREPDLDHVVRRAGSPYRIAVTVCTECKRGWQHGAGAVAEMSPPAVDAAMCDAQWIGDLSSGMVERSRQEISPATRRKVLHRDQGRCRVPGCNAHNNLDIHHILHREDGGTNDISGLITLCEAHHLAHHAGTLVIERVGDEVTFRREGRNRFTRATREVETKEALRGRGFDRGQVKAIIARTITHVGENDISAEQWLAIALRYAAEMSPRPSPSRRSL